MQGMRRLLATGLLGGALVLPYVGGFPLAYLLVLFLLLLSATTLPTAAEVGAITLAAGYAVLGAAFLAAGDAVSLVNFLVLALALPATAALRRLAGPDNIERVRRLAGVGCVIALAVAVTQIGLGSRRPEGFFSDALWATAAVLTLGFIVLGIMLARSGWGARAALSVVAAQLVVSLSGSRGPLAAMLVLAAVVPFVASRNWRTTLFWSVGTALGAALMQILWSTGANRLAILLDSSSQLQAGQEVTDFSIGTRITFLEAGFRAFLDAPILGHGWRGIYDAVGPYLDHARYMLPPDRFHLHSDIANFAVAGGLAGIAAYAAIIAAPWVGALAAPRDGQYRARLAAACALSLAYLLCGLTNTMFGFEFTTVLYVALCAIILGYCRDEP